MPDARYFGPVLDGDAEPHMHWATACAVTLPKEVTHEGRALCKYLERVPRCALHRIEDAIDKILGNVLMEKVAHGIHEDHAGRAPAERLLQPLRTQSQIEASLEWMTRSTTKSFREALSIAVIASGADLRAASDGVPGRVSPLDCCRVSHGGGPRTNREHTRKQPAREAGNARCMKIVLS